MDGTITYLNTDLDLVSSDDLTGLARAFEDRGVFSLHVTHDADGRWYATFETEDQYEEPEPNIAAMVAVAESLTEPHRLVWFACARREFNIGYECGTEPAALTQALSTELLVRIVSIRASLGFTLYSNRT